VKLHVSMMQPALPLQLPSSRQLAEPVAKHKVSYRAWTGWSGSSGTQATQAVLACISTAIVTSTKVKKRVGQRLTCTYRHALDVSQSNFVDDFLAFVNRTGSPAHTVEQSKARLLEAGFTELIDGEKWLLTKGGKYFVTQQGTSICAFAVGGKFESAHGGALIVGAHTDSPCLKLRPCSKIPSNAGTLQLGVDTYGGGLWHTWFDRPLGLAGTIVVATPTGMEERLVRIDAPLCVIPNLAIHLQTQDERTAFKVNKETHLRPVLCSPCGFGSDPAPAPTKQDPKNARGPQHHQELLVEVANAANVKPEELLDVDLCLMDATPSCKMGQYVSSPRIDNLLSTWAAVEAISAFTESGALEDSCDLLVAASFDHEEVGSVSAAGADSAVLERWLEQAVSGLGCRGWAELAPRSFLLSCDCAHALHPNYSDKHQAEHSPTLGQGVVIKTNSNQRYATTPMLAQMVREVGKRADVPIQEFVVRNDCPCGSTIGPLLSAQLGVRTVDVGAPQWAMHSCRETAHCDDVGALRNLCFGLFKHFRDIDKTTNCL